MNERIKDRITLIGGINQQETTQHDGFHTAPFIYFIRLLVHDIILKIERLTFCPFKDVVADE